METKFTKGKWDVLYEIDGTPHIVSSNQDIIATMNSESYDNGKTYCQTEEDKANAKLIVAAPDLLTELTKVRELLIAQGFKTWSQTIIDIDSAIKKATE